MDQALQSNRLSVLKYCNLSEKDIESDVDIVLSSVKQLPHFPKFKEVGFVLCLIRKNIYPEFFDNWDLCSPEFVNTLDVCRIIPLPRLTTELDRISVIEVTDKLSDIYDPITHAKICLMGWETRFQYDYNVREILVIDASKVNMTLIKKLTPSLIKKGFDVGIKGYSLRLAGAHVLYPPSGLSIILSIVKVIMKPKLYERIYLHNNLESLHKVVPKELLPKNYGGDFPDSQTLSDQWYNILRNNRLSLMEESQRRTDESKRNVKLNDDEFFGPMHGSFKKLEFD
ncbi:retinaldehyde-binding protein 1-like [Chrysoperla carnea]|uniref:retinaldehyde-binding protein 1-like n=1 Tax=Chrysoperla carnea TaxID=189513 RepID=UPI001D061D56|nr:retinaldehyde-binding protein 1-like [Chrysoperla carnea]